MSENRTVDDELRIRAARLRTVPWRAVVVYVVVAFGLAWLVSMPVWLTGGADSPHLALLVPIIGAVMMFAPAVAVIVVVRVLKVPRGERLRFLGIWPLRPAKRVVWFAVGAVVVPILLIVIITLLSGVFGLVKLDLVNFSGFQAVLDAKLGALSADARADANMPPVGVLVAIQLIAIPVGAIFNSIFAFGEEVGWRGWLLPALRPLGVWPALLISGAIWGLWHAPLILVGYNFGYTDWRGVVLMMVGCIVWGALLGWVRLRSASIWPAAIGHGALNASAGLVVLFAAADSTPNMAVVGPFGFVAWGVIAVVVIVLTLTGQYRREPELAPRRIMAQIEAPKAIDQITPS